MNTSIFARDYGSGRINYIENDLKYDVPIERQADCLREDLLQVTYDDLRLILDIGWYPQGDINGSFILNVVKDYNWESPVYRCECYEIKSLDDCLQKAIKYCTGSQSN